MKRLTPIVLAAMFALAAALLIAPFVHADPGVPPYPPPYEIPERVNVWIDMPHEVEVGQKPFAMVVKLTSYLSHAVDFDGSVWHGGPGWGGGQQAVPPTTGELYWTAADRQGISHFWRGTLPAKGTAEFRIQTTSGDFLGGPFYFANAVFVVKAPQGSATASGLVTVHKFETPKPAPDSTQRSNAEVTVSINPYSPFVFVGDETNVTLRVNSHGREFGAFLLDLEYDSTHVKVMGVTAGDSIKTCGPWVSVRIIDEKLVRFELSGAALDCDLTVRFLGLRAGAGFLSIPGRVTTKIIVVN